MPTLILRLGVLLLVAVATWLFVRVGKHLVEVKRQRALSIAPSTMFADNTSSKIRILSFSSEDCRQCKLQAPVLQRVIEARGDDISVMEIDAPTQPELATLYQVLTVPTTVILDASGKAQAINYGFANTQRLLAQIDALMTPEQIKISSL